MIISYFMNNEMTILSETQIEECLEAESRATPGPWDDCGSGLKVFAGNMTVCDIRGWGYLTGIGGLRLSEAEAEAIQVANAELICKSRAHFRTALLMASEYLRMRERMTAEIKALEVHARHYDSELQSNDTVLAAGAHDALRWALGLAEQSLSEALEEK